MLRDDEDWDWAFIIKVLQYKLKRTRLCIESNNIVASSTKIAKQIKEVGDLFGAVLDNKYYRELGKKFRRKHGSGKFVYDKKEPGTQSVGVSVRFRGETKGNQDKIHREFRRLHDQADRKLERDLGRAFALMENNIRGWWD